MTAQQLIAHFFSLQPEERMEVLRYILKNIDVAELLATTSTLDDEDWDFTKPTAEA